MAHSPVLTVRIRRLMQPILIMLVLPPAHAAAQAGTAFNVRQFLESPEAMGEGIKSLGRDLAERAGRALGLNDRGAEAVASGAEDLFEIHRDLFSALRDDVEQFRPHSSPGGAKGIGVLDRLNSEKAPEMQQGVMDRMFPDFFRDAVEGGTSAMEFASGAMDQVKQGARDLADGASRLTDRVASYFSDESSYGLEPGSPQAEAANRSLGADTSPTGGDLASLIGGDGSRGIGALFQSNSAAMDAFAEREAARNGIDAPSGRDFADAGSRTPEGAGAAGSVTAQPAGHGVAPEETGPTPPPTTDRAYPERIGMAVTTRCADGRYVTYTVTDDPKFWTTDPKAAYDPCVAEHDDTFARSLLGNATRVCDTCSSGLPSALEARGRERTSGVGSYAPSGQAQSVGAQDVLKALDDLATRITGKSVLGGTGIPQSATPAGGANAATPAGGANAAAEAEAYEHDCPGINEQMAIIQRDLTNTGEPCKDLPAFQRVLARMANALRACPTQSALVRNGIAQLEAQRRSAEKTQAAFCG